MTMIHQCTEGAKVVLLPTEQSSWVARKMGVAGKMVQEAERLRKWAYWR